MRGWLVILGFYGCGTALHEWARVPLPGSLIGMLLLTVALGTGWIRLELVEGASSFLLKHMLLFFIPIVVGVVPQLETVMQKPLPIVIALVSGPVLVMLTAGGVVQRLQKKKQSESMKRRCA